MRFLLNENVSRTVIQLLRAGGHDVLSAKESMRGLADGLILTRAQAEQRIVVTHDKDFGELAFRHGQTADAGVILFRLAGASPDDDNRRMLEVLASDIDWSGHFAVVTEDRIRQRPLPGRREKPR
jgi:predicted nuclease of predicted toxin-antitoxin system